MDSDFWRNMKMTHLHACFLQLKFSKLGEKPTHPKTRCFLKDFLVLLKQGFSEAPQAEIMGLGSFRLSEP
jgi:hypothetical protein